MNIFLKMLGLLLVFAGVVCLVVYATCTPSNVLLVSSLILEGSGILSYIILNKVKE